jgi:hypothetical protein
MNNLDLKKKFFLGSVIGEDIIEEEEEDCDQFSLTESSTVVEKFIRVIESSSNSKFENLSTATKSSNNSEIAASNTNREDIRRKLAFNKPEPSSYEAKAKSNKKNDLEGGLHRTFQSIIFCKGNSDLKARLDYCEYPARSCENLNFCFPAQTEPFH